MGRTEYDERIIDLREAAAVLSASVQTIRRHIVRGLLVARRLSQDRRIYVTEESVNALKSAIAKKLTYRGDNTQILLRLEELERRVRLLEHSYPAPSADKIRNAIKKHHPDIPSLV